MRRWMASFLRDEAGFVSGPEWAIVATILVLAAVTGIMAARQSAGPDIDPAPLVQGR